MPNLDKYYQLNNLKNGDAIKEEPRAEQPQTENVVITGDDVLIEYVKRLINCLKNIKSITAAEKENFESFISHYVWSNQDRPKKSYWERLQNRYSEMVSRRRKLLKSIIKKELASEGVSDPSSRTKEIESRIADKEDKKVQMLKNFNVQYLEEMLNSSTKSVAREVVSTLVQAGKKGTLLILEKRLNYDIDQDQGESIDEEENFISPQKQLEGFGHSLKSSKKGKV